MDYALTILLGGESEEEKQVQAHKYNLGTNVQVKVDNAWMSGIVSHCGENSMEIQFVNAFGALNEVQVSYQSQNVKIATSKSDKILGKDSPNNTIYEFGNPVIVTLSDSKERVPGMVVQVNKKSIVVQYLDAKGNPKQNTFDQSSDLVQLNMALLEDEKAAERVIYQV